MRAYIEKNDGIDTIKQDVTLDLVEKAIEGVKSQQPVRGAAPHPHTQHTEAVVPACTRAWGCTCLHSRVGLVHARVGLVHARAGSVSGGRAG